MADKRVISAAIAIPILLFFVIMGGITFRIGVLVITAIALSEYVGVYNYNNHKVIKWVLILGYIANVIVLFTTRKTEHFMLIINLILLISMSVPIFIKKYDVISSAITIVGYLYIVNFFTLMILIREMNYGNKLTGNKLIWIVFIVAWFSDTFAYYTGRFFGKRKLCPEVSPKKTIEGAFGGLIGSLVGVLLWWLINSNSNIRLFQLLILAILAGCVSQIGDLSASLIKRYVGVKDYGKIMPGHGGILDRFDSILFVTPVVYYYIVLLMG
ncbi:hypothetical protein Q428_03420 [Fervidicella metallireducens AeB]|uniref:Phosphatidate cytidylyltransferase n=1 Tax=Fervidicella metallireducens AeB TaxID=1403537 RepID=A0A017RZH0_9CLOT|nr:phosphatidate cytidylyltransferase [Fervidicella metallireducens]EYE89340.1 hypothetical protein Q428_03420 [Fervidicella metallireducens AeB]